MEVTNFKAFRKKKKPKSELSLDSSKISPETIRKVADIINLEENWLGQARSLKKGNGFGSTDPTISIQICSFEVGLELIHARIPPCHSEGISQNFRTEPSKSIKFLLSPPEFSFSDSNKNKTKTKRYEREKKPKKN